MTINEAVSPGDPGHAAHHRALAKAINGLDVRDVPVEAYYIEADGADWGLALTRAIADAAPDGRAVRLSRVYNVTSTVALVNGAKVYGFGPGTGLKAAGPMTVIESDGVDRIDFRDFLIDGGVTAGYAGAGVFYRGVRIRNADQVMFDGMHVQNCDDWATSFEICNWVTVRNYTHLGNGGNGFPGGRDGIHFLDCRDVLLDGARIWSGDDCVGITSETRDIARITVRNVTGHSEVAAVVTVGNEGATSFAASDLTIENVATFRPEGAVETRANYIVKARAQNTATADRWTIRGVSGESRSYAVWLQGNSTNSLKNIVLTDGNVTSTEGNGIVLERINDFTVTGFRARASGGSLAGHVLVFANYGTLNGLISESSSMWGLQALDCTYLDFNACVMHSNGAATRAGSDGGNGRFVRVTNSVVQGGTFAGATATSYYGMSISDSASLTVSSTTRRAGQVP